RDLRDEAGIRDGTILLHVEDILRNDDPISLTTVHNLALIDPMFFRRFQLIIRFKIVSLAIDNRPRSDPRTKGGFLSRPEQSPNALVDRPRGKDLWRDPLLARPEFDRRDDQRGQSLVGRMDRDLQSERVLFLFMPALGSA